MAEPVDGVRELGVDAGIDQRVNAREAGDIRAQLANELVEDHVLILHFQHDLRLLEQFLARDLGGCTRERITPRPSALRLIADESILLLEKLEDAVVVRQKRLVHRSEADVFIDSPVAAHVMGFESGLQRRRGTHIPTDPGRIRHGREPDPHVVEERMLGRHQHEVGHRPIRGGIGHERQDGRIVRQRRVLDIHLLPGDLVERDQPGHPVGAEDELGMGVEGDEGNGHDVGVVEDEAHVHRVGLHLRPVGHARLAGHFRHRLARYGLAGIQKPPGRPGGDARPHRQILPQEDGSARIGSVTLAEVDEGRGLVEALRTGRNEVELERVGENYSRNGRERFDERGHTGRRSVEIDLAGEIDVIGGRNLDQGLIEDEHALELEETRRDSRIRDGRGAGKIHDTFLTGQPELGEQGVGRPLADRDAHRVASARGDRRGAIGRVETVAGQQLHFRGPVDSLAHEVEPVVEELAELAGPVAVGQRIDGAGHGRDPARRVVEKLEGGVGFRKADRIAAIHDEIRDHSWIERINRRAIDRRGEAHGDLGATRRVGKNGRHDVVLLAHRREPVEGQSGEQRVAGTEPPVGRERVGRVVAHTLDVADARGPQRRETAKFLRESVAADPAEEKPQVLRAEAGLADSLRSHDRGGSGERRCPHVDDRAHHASSHHTSPRDIHHGCGRRECSTRYRHVRHIHRDGQLAGKRRGGGVGGDDRERIARPADMVGVSIAGDDAGGRIDPHEVEIADVLLDREPDGAIAPGAVRVVGGGRVDRRVDRGVAVDGTRVATGDGRTVVVDVANRQREPPFDGQSAGVRTPHADRELILRLVVEQARRPQLVSDDREGTVVGRPVSRDERIGEGIGGVAVAGGERAHGRADGDVLVDPGSGKQQPRRRGQRDGRVAGDVADRGVAPLNDSSTDDRSDGRLAVPQLIRKRDRVIDDVRRQKPPLKVADGNIQRRSPADHDRLAEANVHRQHVPNDGRGTDGRDAGADDIDERSRQFLRAGRDGHRDPRLESLHLEAPRACPTTPPRRATSPRLPEGTNEAKNGATKNGATCVSHGGPFLRLGRTVRVVNGCVESNRRSRGSQTNRKTHSSSPPRTHAAFGHSRKALRFCMPSIRPVPKWGIDPLVRGIVNCLLGFYPTFRYCQILLNLNILKRCLEQLPLAAERGRRSQQP